MADSPVVQPMFNNVLVQAKPFWRRRNNSRPVSVTSDNSRLVVRFKPTDPKPTNPAGSVGTVAIAAAQLDKAIANTELASIGSPPRIMSRIMTTRSDLTLGDVKRMLAQYEVHRRVASRSMPPDSNPPDYADMYQDSATKEWKDVDTWKKFTKERYALEIENKVTATLDATAVAATPPQSQTSRTPEAATATLGQAREVTEWLDELARESPAIGSTPSPPALPPPLSADNERKQQQIADLRAEVQAQSTLELAASKVLQTKFKNIRKGGTTKKTKAQMYALSKEITDQRNDTQDIKVAEILDNLGIQVQSWLDGAPKRERDARKKAKIKADREKAERSPALTPIRKTQGSTRTPWQKPNARRRLEFTTQSQILKNQIQARERRKKEREMNRREAERRFEEESKANATQIFDKYALLVDQLQTKEFDEESEREAQRLRGMFDSGNAFKRHLSPEQIRRLPVINRRLEYAQKINTVLAKLRATESVDNAYAIANRLRTRLERDGKKGFDTLSYEMRLEEAVKALQKKQLKAISPGEFSNLADPSEGARKVLKKTAMPLALGVASGPLLTAFGGSTGSASISAAKALAPAAGGGAATVAKGGAATVAGGGAATVLAAVKKSNPSTQPSNPLVPPAEIIDRSRSSGSGYSPEISGGFVPKDMYKNLSDYRVPDETSEVAPWQADNMLANVQAMDEANAQVAKKKKPTLSDETNDSSDKDEFFDTLEFEKAQARGTQLVLKSPDPDEAKRRAEKQAAAAAKAQAASAIAAALKQSETQSKMLADLAAKTRQNDQEKRRQKELATAVTLRGPGKPSTVPLANNPVIGRTLLDYNKLAEAAATEPAAKRRAQEAEKQNVQARGTQVLISPELAQANIRAEEQTANVVQTVFRQSEVPAELNAKIRKATARREAEKQEQAKRQAAAAAKRWAADAPNRKAATLNLDLNTAATIGLVGAAGAAASEASRAYAASKAAADKVRALRSIPPATEYEELLNVMASEIGLTHAQLTAKQRLLCKLYLLHHDYAYGGHDYINRYLDCHIPIREILQQDAEALKKMKNFGTEYGANRQTVEYVLYNLDSVSDDDSGDDSSSSGDSFDGYDTGDDGTGGGGGGDYGTDGSLWDFSPDNTSSDEESEARETVGDDGGSDRTAPTGTSIAASVALKHAKRETLAAAAEKRRRTRPRAQNRRAAVAAEQKNLTRRQAQRRAAAATEQRRRAQPTYIRDDLDKLFELHREDLQRLGPAYNNLMLTPEDKKLLADYVLTDNDVDYTKIARLRETKFLTPGFYNSNFSTFNGKTRRFANNDEDNFRVYRDAGRYAIMTGIMSGKDQYRIEQAKARKAKEDQSGVGSLRIKPRQYKYVEPVIETSEYDETKSEDSLQKQIRRQLQAGVRFGDPQVRTINPRNTRVDPAASLPRRKKILKVRGGKPKPVLKRKKMPV